MLNSLNRYKVDMKVKVLTRMIDNLRYSIQFSGQNTSRDDDRMTQSGSSELSVGDRVLVGGCG